MMREKGLLICIIGVDGVGKTTHVHKLLDRLKQNGVICRYTWFRFFHFISLPLLAFCRLTNLTVYEGKNDQRMGRHEFYRSKVISFLYPWFLFIDILPMYFIKIYVPLRFGYTVVCDRFIYDTLVDLMIDLKDFDIYKKYIGRLFINLIPKDACTILLDLNESSIRERRYDLRNDQSLKARRKMYNLIAKEFKLPIIENNLTIEDIHNKIYTYLGVDE